MRASSRFVVIFLVTPFLIVNLFFLPTASAQDRVVVMPVDFESYLLTAGGSRELQPEWSELGTGNLQNALNEVGNTNFETVTMPELSAEEQSILEEHLALYEVAVGNSVVMITQARMKHKITNYDYTIGSGLAFLQEKYGVDKLFLFNGEQEKSSGGRIAMMILGAAVGGVTGVAIVPRIGTSFAVIGIVDLESGNIEWVNYMTPMNKGDVRKPEAATESIEHLYGQFPNGKLMRATAED